MSVHSRSDSRGFTLIEVLLVVSLVALFSTIFVLNLESLMGRSDVETLENEYWRAVDAARSGAVFGQKPHFIEWDAQQRAFLVRSESGLESFPVRADTIGESTRLEVRFEEVAPENSYVLIAGQLVAKREIAKVGFFPDGTCSPYVASIQLDDLRIELRMDPWTGVQLVDAGEERRGG